MTDPKLIEIMEGMVNRLKNIHYDMDEIRNVDSYIKHGNSDDYDQMLSDLEKLNGTPPTTEE